MKDHITIEGNNGAFAAYIARPKTSSAPAVVVLQEVFGVNADIRRHCDELAEQGFLAVAPDLFWRQEPGVDLSVTSEADWQHGLRLYGDYDRDAGAKTSRAPSTQYATSSECNGRVAVLGEIKAALAKKPDATVYSDPGQNHAFTRHNGAHYNAAAAALANGRTSEFLHQQLR